MGVEGEVIAGLCPSYIPPFSFDVTVGQASSQFGTGKDIVNTTGRNNGGKGETALCGMQGAKTVKIARFEQQVDPTLRGWWFETIQHNSGGRKASYTTHQRAHS